MQRVWIEMLHNGKFKILIEGLGIVGDTIDSRREADTVLRWIKNSGLYFSVPGDHK
jgi:hypothetical protein